MFKLNNIYGKRKFIAIVLLQVFLLNFIPNSKLYALTSGPSAPEFDSFTPASVNNMVDPFSGNFSYNIPLMDVGGYPININYSDGVTMDQEASWVGLGWNLNIGNINRNLRGIPDDFHGDHDKITETTHMKDNETAGVNLSLGAEIFGLDGGGGLSLNVGTEISYNTYTGVSIKNSISPSFSLQTASCPLGLNVGLDLSSGPDGFAVSPNISASVKVSKSENSDKSGNSTHLGFGASTSFSNRSGVKSLNFSSSIVSKNTARKGSEDSNGEILEKDKISTIGSLGSSASWDFNPSPNPLSINKPMNSFSFGYTAKTGLDAFDIDGTGNIGGYYNKSNLINEVLTSNAYGFLNLYEGQNDNDGVLDFSREDDIPFGEFSVNLAASTYTYDVYTVNGQGIGGSYRAFRNDCGIVGDKASHDLSMNGNVNFDAASGNLVKGGLSANVMTSVNLVDKWEENNIFYENNRYKKFSEESNFEPYYFKEIGELSVDDNMPYTSIWGNDDPVQFILSPSKGFNVKLENKLSNSSTALSNLSKDRKGKRKQLFSFLTKNELEKRISTLNLSGDNYPSKVNANAKGHHIGEITVTKDDGSRYVFGKALYNVVNLEVSFSAQGLLPTDSENQLHVTYEEGDNSPSNKRGIDNYYYKKSTDPYSYSHLLTAILSPDYSDKTNDGITEDDNGTYVKFYYEQLQPLYKWRMPYEKNSANYSQGLKSDHYDDKANYVYGEKEIAYISLIETKTHIAVFTLEDREDGLGVIDENGGKDNSSKIKCLKKIDLYTLEEYKKVDGIPLKSVHFVYDYSLCPGIPNNINNGGKLTLKQIYFTYQNSSKARFSPYVFSYEDDDENTNDNPSYNPSNVDKWGSYMPESGLLNIADPNRNNGEFPYVKQNDANGNSNKSKIDEYASVWCLKKIYTPSGASINIIYESDDYKYVQDKRVTEMIDIKGFSNSSNETVSSIESSQNPLNKLWENTGNLSLNIQNNNFLYFRLNESISLSSYSAALEKVKNDYGLNDVIGSSGRELFLKCLVSITATDYEYVNCYAKVKGLTLVDDGTVYKYGCLELENELAWGNEYLHPMALAAMVFGKSFLPRKVFNLPEPDNTGPENLILALTNADLISNAVSAFNSVYKNFAKKNFAQNVILSKSLVKLECPRKFKLGGGDRVKRISINDNWNQSCNGCTSSNYGYEYEYLSEEGYSSGVAANEPGIGGDESALLKPIFIKNKRALLAPREINYTETPLVKATMPGASIGYSTVTIKTISNNLDQNVSNNSSQKTGKNVLEFHTCKDFPYKERMTNLDIKVGKTNPALKLLKIKSKLHYYGSQGYTVVTNDMHGKPKAERQYSENGAQISFKYYYYKGIPNIINNTKKIIEVDGKVKDALIGREMDVVVDCRQIKNETESAGTQNNFATFMVGILAIPVPTIIPSWQRSELVLRTAVVTKVINYHGILDRVVTFNLGSKVIQENLAYDSETGDVLLSSTQNEFNDPIYSFKYPAYWAFEGMRPSYKNINVYSETVNLSSGIIASGFSNFLYEGDEVLLYDTSSSSTIADYGWVKYVSNGGQVDKVVIDHSGNTISGSYDKVKIVRSGYRNMQNLPMMNITSNSNPIFPLNQLQLGLNFNLLPFDAQVIEYSGTWQTFCECENNLTNESEYNPFIYGIKGNWKVKKEYKYLTSREVVASNTRKSGNYLNFSPFYYYNSSIEKWLKNPTGWQFVNCPVYFSNMNTVLEEYNPLNIYSSVVYGYNDLLPGIIGKNTKYRELGFDSFEDYNFYGCDQKHFSFREFSNLVTTEKSHTGHYSIEVEGGNSNVIINRKTE